MTIGERIKNRRNELGWSQRKLSDKMGYSNHSTITKIEAGKVDIPQSRIEQFAEVLGVTLSYLIGVNEKIEKNPVEMAEFHFEMITNEDITEIFEDFKKLNAKEKKIVKDLIHSLANAEA
jgi:transcriptional regulator with XRE-family HTH domain